MTARVWPPVLNWSAGADHWDYTAAADDEPMACVLCGGPTFLRSDRGLPSHKTCAERWFEQHPDAWELYERRRDADAGTRHNKHLDDDQAAVVLTLESTKEAA